MAKKKFKLEDLKFSDFGPLWDNVFVRPIVLTKKGIFNRPVNEEDKSELGEVIGVGAGVEDKTIKVGSIVLYNKYSTTKNDIGEELVVRAEDIVGVFNP